MPERILAAALAILRKDGWSALTQPRVARAAGLRQSHLTYYFPTRSDLVTAVSHEVARRLLAGFDGVVGDTTRDPSQFGKSFAQLCSPEQTRLLLTLVLAADSEHAIRKIFRALTKDVRERITDTLKLMGVAADDETVALIHALGIGLAVLDLARDEPAARRELKTVTEMTVSRVVGRGKKK